MQHLPLISRGTFVGDVRRAIVHGHRYATGKLGTSEKYWMYYEVVLASDTGTRRRRAFELSLKFHGLQQSGLFPVDLTFIREFNSHYVDDVRQLDSVGLFRDRLDLEQGIIDHYALSNAFVHFQDQEPDRSLIANDDACYLPALRGKKLLIVSPFARLLQERATEPTFERVWAKTGKRWFGATNVDALEFPYGYDQTTHDRFGNALTLLTWITERMADRDFDVALIAAGALGIPLAAEAKRLGKVGIALGGHLQVLFGVLGKRWTDQAVWRDSYINDAWIEMPARYRPTLMTVDGGAYW